MSPEQVHGASPAASPAPGSRNPMAGAVILKASEECPLETALPAPSSPRISGYPGTAALSTSHINPCLALKTNQGVRETARARRPGAPAPLRLSRPHPAAAQTSPRAAAGGRAEAVPCTGEPWSAVGAEAAPPPRGTRPRPGAHLRPRLLPPPGRDPPLPPTALPHPSGHRGGAPAYPAPLYGPGSPSRDSGGRRLRSSERRDRASPARPAGRGHGGPRARRTESPSATSTRNGLVSVFYPNVIELWDCPTYSRF